MLHKSLEQLSTNTIWILHLNVLGEWGDIKMMWCDCTSSTEYIFPKCILLGARHTDVRYCLAHSKGFSWLRRSQAHCAWDFSCFPFFISRWLQVKCYLLLLNLPLSSETNFRKEIKNSIFNYCLPSYPWLRQVSASSVLHCL